MRFRGLAVGVAALLAAHAANATVYFNNITGVPSGGSNGPSDPTLLMGASFTAANPDFSAITLLLGKSSPSTSGSTLIYLVPDSGSGGAGNFGLPTLENNAGAFTSLAGSELIGTVLDSSLAATLAPTTFWVSPALTTSAKEYWVVAQSNASSSFEWSYANDASGVGTAGQGYFNDYQGSNLLPVSDTPDGGYQFEVQTPEPATIAILGAGLAGLGLFRRRKDKQV